MSKTMDKTTSKKLKKPNSFRKKEVYAKIKSNFRVKFNHDISGRDVSEIWKKYCELVFVPELLKEGEFQPNFKSGIFEIVKMKREDTVAGRLFEKGYMFVRGGGIKKFDRINQNKWNHVYKIRYNPVEKKITGVRFKADKKITKQLCNVLNTTPKDYKFVMK